MMDSVEQSQTEDLFRLSYMATDILECEGAGDEGVIKSPDGIEMFPVSPRTERGRSESVANTDETILLVRNKAPYFEVKSPNAQ